MQVREISQQWHSVTNKNTPSKPTTVTFNFMSSNRPLSTYHSVLHVVDTKLVVSEELLINIRNIEFYIFVSLILFHILAMY